MTKKNKDDFNWFQMFFLNVFGRMFDKFDDEDAEERFNKSRGIKSINISWIIVIVVGLIIYFTINYFKDSKNVCLFLAELEYHQEEEKACKRLGQTQGCDLYFMDTPTWGEVNKRHDDAIASCKN